MHFDRHIAYWARYRGEQPYMTFGDQVLTWGELDRKAEALAAHLLTLGVKPGDRVGILLNNCLEWCIGFAAAIRISAITVALNPKYGKFELRAIAEDADCAVMVARPADMAKLGHSSAGAAGDRVLLFDLTGRSRSRTFDEVIAARAKAPRCDRPDSDTLAICYTSGTTGLPKGIVLSHRAVETMATRVGARFGWELGQERVLILAPLAFTGGVISNLSVQIVIGASAWLELGVNPPEALKRIVENRLTLMAGVPALWERMASASEFDTVDISSMRSAITGGAPVSVDLARRYAAKGVVIRQQFGVSENSGCVFCPDRESAIERPHSCGPALPGVEAEIRDDDDRPVADGTIGEICIRSPQLMEEYWRNPEATAASMQGGWYHTGDLGRLDEFGGLVVADRKKNMLISGGVNIYPAEIERAMMTIPGIVEVVVFGLPSATWGQEVTALVHAPTFSHPDQILVQARELLGSMKAPKHVVLSAERLPRTSSDKISRQDLQGLYDRIVITA